MLTPLLLAPLRRFHDISFANIVGFIWCFTYALFVFCVNKKQGHRLSDVKILLCLLIGVEFLIIPIYIVSFENIKGSLMQTIACIFGVFSAYVCYKCFSKGRIIATAIGIICLSAAIWLSFEGERLWLNKIGFGSFTGRLAHAEFIPLRFQTAIGDTVKIEDFRGKYLVLDVWFTYCGVCFQKFPRVQALYERYKGNENIVIYSLHARMEEKDRWGWGGESYYTGAAIIKREGYSFPTLSICMNDPLLREEAGVQFFPTVLIFDKESRLIFRGSVEFAERYLRRRLRE